MIVCKFCGNPEAESRMVRKNHPLTGAGACVLGIGVVLTLTFFFAFAGIPMAIVGVILLIVGMCLPGPEVNVFRCGNCRRTWK
jgi:hypothetical protein